MRKPMTGHIYVLETTGALVKVGFSKAPKRRLCQHVRDTRKKALSISREWVSPRHAEAGLNEEELLAACERLGGTVCGMGREWFSGIYYDDVVAAALKLDCTETEGGAALQIVRYSLSWPAWLAERVTEAADTRTMTLATWLREAALEKLEREASKGES